MISLYHRLSPYSISRSLVFHSRGLGITGVLKGVIYLIIDSEE